MENRQFYERITTERMARAVIASVVPPADNTTGIALQHAGSALNLLQLAISNDQIPRVSPPDAHLWRRRFDIADITSIRTNLELGEAEGQILLIPGDPDWPTSLSPLGYSAPLALWAQGNTYLLTGPPSHRVALVGGSECSPYGFEVASDLSEWVGNNGRTVVALHDTGIAQASTLGGLRGTNDVITVLPHGLDQEKDGFDYLRKKVARLGLLVTDRPPGAAVSTRSNRILAALAGVTTVIEAQALSDSILIASMAHACGRRVGAVPGRVTDAASAGTNDLLRHGATHLISNGSDIIDLLDTASPRLDLHTLMQGAPTHTAARAPGLSR
ncbi:DNA processing protein DprA [Leucobacter coleopterorum]|uniref:DNA processing protein DprA n=1 Tax=Leucobacter coleopterorum TaxID=2714933 RepID=A0ABX6K0T0_9MICO|nr:DNA-processing protein DprA [Leucobacter coleopterorum]QIM18675.1 DNA processing protein DprA [Leucobacter coleopterorum]